MKNKIFHAMKNRKAILDGAKIFLYFAALQFAVYGLATWNIRAISQANITNAIASDGFISCMQWTIMKKVAEAKSEIGRLGYMFGGMTGTVVAIKITQLVFGH